MTKIPWDERSIEQRNVSWKFCRTLLEHFQNRFFDNVPNDVVLGYYLDTAKSSAEPESASSLIATNHE